jgi:hypothetical protein
MFVEDCRFMLTATKKTAIGCVAGLLFLGAIYLLAQLFWPIELVTGLRSDAVKRERGLLYETDQAALAAELRKFAYDHRWSETQQGDNPTIFWPPDPAIPSALRILQPTSVAIFDDRIMFERGGPIHHFGIVVFRQSSPAEKSKDNGFAGEQLLKEFQPGVWFYSDHRKLPRP